VRPEALSNRQDLPQFYRVNGAIYLADIPFLIQNESFFSPRTFAYRMPALDSIDIDTLLDFKLADLILTEKSGKE
jgi:N-acylneuraminate cytidylyltransferase/CMP-N,N'-diacetyllegionaminic acid synthase